MGYSPWGRKASDVTERLHFLSLCGFQQLTAVHFSSCRSESPRELDSITGPSTHNWPLTATPTNTLSYGLLSLGLIPGVHRLQNKSDSDCFPHVIAAFD